MDSGFKSLTKFDIYDLMLTMDCCLPHIVTRMVK